MDVRPLDYLMYLLYNLILFLAAFLVLPYYLAKAILTGKYRQSLGQKLGLIRPQQLAGLSARPRVWFHAVSVGEVMAVRPVIEAFRACLPEAAIIVSTSTETGQEMARQGISADAFIYYPLDIPLVIKRVLDLVNPDVFVATETELWPNFSRICAARGIRMVMVNGRISPRSFRLYSKTRFFWRRIIGNYAAVGVISEGHADRFAKLGLAPEKIRVLGNAKYDGLVLKAQAGLEEELRGRFNIGRDIPVLVAGSTHEGEETVILDVYRIILADLPTLRLILVPRHIERAARALTLIREAGFPDVVTVSGINKGEEGPFGRVILVDVIGELFKIYSLATMVFCGGSLVPRGGQNILEAAAWGKVVFYGPHMEDFPDEAAALEEVGAGIMIKSGDELLSGIRRLLVNAELRAQLGRQGKEMVQANMGVAAKYARLIRDVIKAQSLPEN
ncbi:MAG: 3-deoxy-D-manno-octulosonic acid transferase [Smithellaceae bacterium]|nr:3-deoxy-D-manno-octulosonic acid transferase [Smithellaceae bacterium]